MSQQTLEIAIKKEQSMITEKLEAFRQLILNSHLLKEDSLYVSSDLDQILKHINTVYDKKLKIASNIGNN